MTYPNVTDPGWSFGPQPWQGSPYLAPPLPFPPHACRWQVTDIKVEPGRTLALQRCSGPGLMACDDVRTKWLDGEWTLAQLRGEDTGEPPAPCPSGSKPGAETDRRSR